MFHRSGNSSQQGKSAVAAAFDDVLAELGSRDPSDREDPADAETLADTAAEDDVAPADESSRAAAEAPEPTVTERVSAADRILQHADTLRATRDAQQRAEEMLALAAATRNEATDEAEKIVLEAKAAADEVRADAEAEAERTRSEAVTWVKQQRARVESATSQLTRNAERDAENIRTEAMRSAMLEAEQTARLYVGEAAARGARDAEEIRGAAREVLHRAAELGADLQTSMTELVRALEAATGVVADQMRAIDALLDDVRRDSVGSTGQSADVDPADGPGGPADLDSEPGLELDATAEPDPAGEPDAEAIATETDTDTAESVSTATTGRQLGALFRDQVS